MAEGDKYQVLTTIDGKAAVIERSGARDNRWKIFIPDAGAPTTASQVARLLNEEWQMKLSQAGVE